MTAIVLAVYLMTLLFDIIDIVLCLHRGVLYALFEKSGPNKLFEVTTYTCRVSVQGAATCE